MVYIYCESARKRELHENLILLYISHIFASFRFFACFRNPKHAFAIIIPPPFSLRQPTQPEQLINQRKKHRQHPGRKRPSATTHRWHAVYLTTAKQQCHKTGTAHLAHLEGVIYNVTPSMCRTHQFVRLDTSIRKVGHINSKSRTHRFEK